MTAKETINKIRTMLFGEQAPAPVPAENPKPIEMDEVKTQDGKILKIDTMAVGGNVVLGDAPAPDGEYLLEDGSAVVVKSGLIVEISKGEDQPGMPEEMKAKFSAQEQTIATLNGQVDDLKKSVANYQESVKQMFELVETISNNSIEKPKEKVDWNKLSPLEKFRANKSFN